ncbi:MAG TPA: YtxH domain-containing protein [Clostridia bacterium]|nr:YtxH domain-containing protein [Clostridia bacterium]
MRKNYINGLVAGGLLGVAAAMMYTSRTEDDVKKKIERGSKSMVNMATRMIPGMKSR